MIIIIIIITIKIIITNMRADDSFLDSKEISQKNLNDLMRPLLFAASKDSLLCSQWKRPLLFARLPTYSSRLCLANRRFYTLFVSEPQTPKTNAAHP